MRSFGAGGESAAEWKNSSPVYKLSAAFAAPQWTLLSRTDVLRAGSRSPTGCAVRAIPRAAAIGAPPAFLSAGGGCPLTRIIND
jgi:hypothetical protein